VGNLANSDHNVQNQNSSPPSTTPAGADRKGLDIFAVPSSDHYTVWLLALVVLAFVTFFLMYWYDLSWPHKGLMSFLRPPPNSSVFMIAAGGALTTFFLNWFMRMAFDKFRWKLAFREQGLGLVDFMALSPNTSWWTLAKLFIAYPSNPSTGTRIDVFKSYLEPFRFYSGLRCDPSSPRLIVLSVILLTFTVVLTLILCFAMDVKDFYVPKGDIFPHVTGLPPINYTVYYSSSTNTMKQSSASRILGQTHGGQSGVIKTLFLDPLKISDGDCEGISDAQVFCYRGNALPFLRDFSLQEIANLNATSENYIRGYRVPFYQLEIFATNNYSVNSIRIYGCGFTALAVTAQDATDSDYLLGSKANVPLINSFRFFLF
jgi:hypothetical protein